MGAPSRAGGKRLTTARAMHLLRSVLGEVVDVERPERFAELAFPRSAQVVQPRDPATDVRLGFVHVARGGFGCGDAPEEGPKEGDIETPRRAPTRAQIQLLGGQALQ